MSLHPGQVLIAPVVSEKSYGQIAQNRYNAGVTVKTDLLQAQTQLANAQDQNITLTLQRSQLEALE